MLGLALLCVKQNSREAAYGCLVIEFLMNAADSRLKISYLAGLEVMSFS